MRQRMILRELLPFITIWFGQVVSIFGSGLTGFALGVWVYQQTSSATLFAFIALSSALPGILVSPVAGALVDRWDRRLVMLLCNAGSCLGPLAIYALLRTGQLQIWQIYVAIAFLSLLSAFHQPAFFASITMLVPQQQYGRANGMVQLGIAAGRILSPVVAGILIVAVNISITMLIDSATFIFAIVTLLLVRIPRPARSAEGKAGQGRLTQESAYGWKYIRARHGLLGLLIFFALTNFTLGIVQTLITPLVLGFADPPALGRVLSVAGMGMLAGGLVMSIWGGPRRRVAAILGLTLLQGVILFLGGVQPSTLLISTSAFVFLFCSVIIGGCSQVIWQNKVAPDVQGRVFAIRSMIAWSTLPLAYAVAGPLADYVFNPLLAPNGALASNIGQIVGVGASRGIGLLFIVMGLLMAAAVLGGYLYPPLRRLESEIPDAVARTAPAAAEAPGLAAESYSALPEHG